MRRIIRFARFNEASQEKTQDSVRIHGSGLFAWDCMDRLEAKQMIDILDWYESLPADKKEYVDILRDEVRKESKDDYDDEAYNAKYRD